MATNLPKREDFVFSYKDHIEKDCVVRESLKACFVTTWSICERCRWSHTSPLFMTLCWDQLILMTGHLCDFNQPTLIGFLKSHCLNAFWTFKSLFTIKARNMKRTAEYVIEQFKTERKWLIIQKARLKAYKEAPWYIRPVPGMLVYSHCSQGKIHSQSLWGSLPSVTQDT